MECGLLLALLLLDLHNNIYKGDLLLRECTMATQALFADFDQTCSQDDTCSIILDAAAAARGARAASEHDAAALEAKVSHALPCGILFIIYYL